MSLPDQEPESAPQLGLNVSLASTLLELEQENRKSTQAIGGQRWRFGIQVLDKELPQNVLSGEKVICIATSPLVDLNVSLSVSVTATHIVDSAQRAARANVIHKSTTQIQPNVYVVTQPQNVATTIKQLHSTISQAHSAANIASPVSLLDTVSILQYLNIAGLAESISDVSAALTAIATPERQRTVLLLQGLTAVISESQRRSGAVQTAAILASILANIQNLVRSNHGSLLVLLELEASWVQVSSTIATGRSTSTMTSPAPPALSNEGVVLESSFASSAGKVLRLTGMGSIQAKLIEEVSGCIIVVHNGSDRIQEDGAIVEVVKSDEAFGVWSQITT